MSPFPEAGADRPREECGIAGVVLPPEAGPGDGAAAARTVFFALFALQHRGQEAAGIASSDGAGIASHRDLGLVSQVFRENSLDRLEGRIAIGHTRYSTAGASSLRNTQPFVMDTKHGPIAVAHNGTIANAPELRRALLAKGVGLSTASDSELLAMDLAGAQGPDWPSRIASTMGRWIGAYSLLVLTREAIYALRDPWGFRPLSFGRLEDGAWAVASEDSALRMIGAEASEAVGGGEIVELGFSGAVRHRGLPPAPRAACSFEYVYFSRPDSRWNGRSVLEARRAMGRILAEEAPAAADMVVSVPDSAIPMAIGYAAASGLPYEEGLVKNRYVARTFIEPTEALRRRGVALKFSPLPEAVADRSLVLVDDSIVRGVTTAALVALLRKAGAREIHLRIASPPILHPCFMGVDMGREEELVARRLDAPGLARELGADSLSYLSLAGLGRAIGVEGLCGACFSGTYPIRVDGAGGKEDFEGGRP